MHAAAELNHKFKFERKEDLPLGDLKDCARDAFVKKASDEGIYLTKEERPAKARILNDGLDDTHRCVEVYRGEVAPKIMPAGVEARFIVDAGFPVPLSFQIDVWDEAQVIHDFKTTKKTPGQNAIREEIQPVFYYYGFWKHFSQRPKDFAYHYLIARRGKDGNPTSTGYEPQAWTPATQDINALFARIESVMEMLKTGTFPPAQRNHWSCDPKWCGYFDTCKYVGNAPAKKWL
jgi:hypothetical protein